MALPISNSPDITSLDFLILYDISGAIPLITLTNNSVGNPSGTTRLNNCTWWYVVTTPSGTPIHEGSETTPDVSSANWSTLVIPNYSWPTIFGNPPCGQVEFSCSAPYICTLYVKDSNGTIYSLSKPTTICRPNGSTTNTCGSFGGSNVSITVKCASGILQAVDSTNYAYQNVLIPSVKTNLWTLIYPLDQNGNQPANKTATNTPNVNFPIMYSGDNYKVVVNNFATYEMGNGVTIKIQYKGANTFAVLCNIDFCKLQCKIRKFYELSRQSCEQLEDPALTAKITRINLLMNSAITGVIQPLCGIDVPATIAEIEKIGDFDDNCDCGCGDAGINLSNPTGPSTVGGCCPVTVDVIDIGTDAPPVECPGSYFPVKVKDPTEAITIGTAQSMSDLIGIVNSYPAWQNYGVAFAEGNCKVGFFTANGATPVAIPIERISITPLPPSLVTGKIITVGGDILPPECPNSPYPKNVYNPTSTTIIGLANTIADVVAIVNANSAWQAYGTASVQDNCHVQWNLTNPNNLPPSIPVGNITPACTGGQQFYALNLLDACTNQVAPFTFPINAYVDFGSGKVSLGYVANEAALVAALNATPTKPSTVTFSAGISQIGVTTVRNSDCTIYSGTITIYSDANQRNLMLVGPNHGYMTASPALAQGEAAFGMRTNSYMGKIVAAEMVWHQTQIGNILLVTDTVQGRILCYDVTNPLVPIFIKSIQLTSPGTTNFSGIPHSATMASGGTPINSWYSLYFPTDFHAMALNEIYIVQALSGTIWKVDYTQPSGSEVVDAFQATALLGKCPRVIIKNHLYFTQDGDLEQAAGLASGVAEGSVITLDLGTFNSGGIATRNIITAADEYFWAATYDGSNKIYYIGDQGSIADLNLTTSAVNLFRHVLFNQAFFRLNAKFFLGKIYASALQFDAGVVNTSSIIIDAATRAVTQFKPFYPHGSSSPNQSHYNFLPLGQCLGVLTYDNWANVANPQGGVALFDLSGNFLSNIDLPVGNIYNVLPYNGISVYTPTSFT